MDTPPADSRTSTQDFIARLGDADEGVRICAALRLGRLGRAGHAAVPALLGLLRGGTVTDRRVAALALGKIGPPAREAVPILLEEMGRTCDGGFSNFAAEAISKIAPGASNRLAA
jgi:HEAT repeat protein